MSVRWTRPALRQLDEIGDYYARSSVVAAELAIARIMEATALIESHPASGRPGRVEGTREIVARRSPFIIAYRLRDSRPEILAVFHGARLWPDNFR